MEITIIAETSGEGLHPVTEQLVGAASSLGGAITVLCPGGVGSNDASVISGVTKVISLQGDCFSSFDSGSWSTVMAPFSQGMIMASSSPSGRELGAQIASKIGAPIVQDITGIEPGYKVTRSVYSGKAVETSSLTTPCVVTLRQNAFEGASGGGSAEIVVVDNSSEVSVAVKEAIAKAGERMDVSDAEIVISGGRGMGDPSNFSHLNEVADVIGAAVGASRAAVDSWDEIPHSMQVGQTGKTVNPTLYIAVGISGAIQHLAGMRSSKYIVAINKDPDAPIFGVADYGIVATWEDALPALKEELGNLS
ncbi:MAG TPA: electron transfer flavoprotein subunit alpha/FixB family protein [Candidatus Thalassarchaeaceae archaeon]|nr:MAG TPA: electron transfer flavoprotein subunit alpha/FixB family protein [Candidatus Poseidoniales archaeon]HII29034.1 electron transfer flavoprotein subunit alpha/FixB family protein [Candidatus Thalassarchaeaceae archaeon]|tara:strand:+ start:289 stop:1209 length:921 start_codon:yes stop_codon:yes gene_type:complete